jgi:hypothetical protein
MINLQIRFFYYFICHLLICRPAERDVPKYKEVVEEGESHIRTDNKYEMGPKEETISTEFSHKTEQLLDFIEKKYLTGKWSLDRRGKQIMNKMKLAENSNKVSLLSLSNPFSITFSGKSYGVWI